MNFKYIFSIILLWREASIIHYNGHALYYHGLAYLTMMFVEWYFEKTVIRIPVCQMNGLGGLRLYF